MRLAFDDLDLAEQVGVDLVAHWSSSVSGIGESSVSTLSALPTRGLTRDLHAGDVDPGLTETLTVDRDNAGAVGVEHHDVVLLDRQLNGVAVDRDELLDLLRTGQRAGHRDLAAVGERRAA